ncbi:MAG: type II toxin-antitoxin system VapC family toxin [Beijerinckiaceae bacterium]
MFCDASILVPLFVTEPSSMAVMAMMGNEGKPVISDFAIGEVCSAISIRLRRREIERAEADEIVSDLDLWAEQKAHRVVTETSDIIHATRLVRRFDLGLRMPDALTLAIAQRHNIPLATQDVRQAAAATALGLRVITPTQLQT